MSTIINNILLVTMIALGLVVVGMLAAWALTGSPAFLIAGMSGFAAVGASIGSYRQNRRNQARRRTQVQA